MLISTGGVAHLNINVLSRCMSSEASSEPSQNLSGSFLLPQKLQNWVLNASLEFTWILFKAFLLEEKPRFNFFLHNFAYLKNYCQGLLEKSAHTETSSSSRHLL